MVVGIFTQFASESKISPNLAGLRLYAKVFGLGISQPAQQYLVDSSRVASGNSAFVFGQREVEVQSVVVERVVGATDLGTSRFLTGSREGFSIGPKSLFSTSHPLPP